MEDLSFDEWFDIFVDECRKLGYDGAIDKYSHEWSYEDTKTPESAAKEFIDELNS